MFFDLGLTLLHPFDRYGELTSYPLEERLRPGLLCCCGGAGPLQVVHGRRQFGALGAQIRHQLVAEAERVLVEAQCGCFFAHYHLAVTKGDQGAVGGRAVGPLRLYTPIYVGSYRLVDDSSPSGRALAPEKA